MIDRLTSNQIVQRVTGTLDGHEPTTVAFIEAAYRVGDRDGYARDLADGRREVLDKISPLLDRLAKCDLNQCLSCKSTIAEIEAELMSKQKTALER